MTTQNTSMAGKVCMITGGTSGIGRVAAEALARQGARLVIIGRSAERLANTSAEISQATGNTSIEYLLADLASQSAIRHMAKQFSSRHDRLDVLLNNAGAIFFQRQLSVDGIEMTLALNHLGYFLTTVLLFDILKSSAPARVVNVSSDAHRMVKQFDFTDPQGERAFGGLRAYALSKLANVLFTRELARRLEGMGVTANALHPGLVATRFGLNNGWRGRFMRWASDLVSIPADAGARTAIYLASAPEVANVTGQYFVKETPVAASPAARDPEAARRLWALSEQLTGAPQTA